MPRPDAVLVDGAGCTDGLQVAPHAAPAFSPSEAELKGAGVVDNGA